jgi:RNA 3'-terminal phosphate cyclase-like protein
VGPSGRGAVHLSVSNMKCIEQPLKWTDEGLVRRVRGVAWTVNMGAQYATALFTSAKGVLLKLLADVQIFTDVVSARQQPVRSLA